MPVGLNANQAWKENPFDGKVDDEYIWGRGALDDKSGVIAILEAISYLLKNNFSPERTIYFSFGHDEEIGGEKIFDPSPFIIFSKQTDQEEGGFVTSRF